MCEIWFFYHNINTMVFFRGLNSCRPTIHVWWGRVGLVEPLFTIFCLVFSQLIVGIVLKHGYILHIYPTSMTDEKNQGVSWSPMVKIHNWQMYMPTCYFMSRKCKNKKINASVHHIRVKFVYTSLPSPKWYNRHYSLYCCMDHCYLVFIKKIYTIIMCLYYIDLLYNDIFYTISHYIII